jgi:hypothetical protein
MTLLTLPLLLACSDGDGTTPEPETPCEDIPVDECSDTPGCTNAVASLLDVDAASGRDCWSQDRQNAACVAEGNFGDCDEAETPAAPPDDPAACLLFSNSCTPAGWVACDEVPELTCPVCVADTSPASIPADITITGRVGLGRALAPAGDTNGDGYQDLLTGYKKGAVMLFGPFSPGEREVGANDAIWEQEEVDDRAGTALAGLGDLNNDGINDIAIGAPHYGPDGVADGTGAVYIFKGPLGPGKFSLADASTTYYGENLGDELGSALAFGRLTDDGLWDLVVAAPLTDSNGSQSGSIYVIAGPIGPGKQGIENAVFSEILGESELGRPLAVQDVNGDGIDDLIYGQDPASATVLYGPLSRGNTKAATGERVTPLTKNANRMSAVAIGDLDNDGDLDLAWSAADDTTNGKASGAVWTTVDSWGAGNQTVEPTHWVLGRCETDEVGQALAFGDVTGDGIDDLLVGGAGTDSTQFGVAVFKGPITPGDLLITDADIWLGDAPASAMALIDLDGDGVLDIAAGNMDSATVYIWFGGGW